MAVYSLPELTYEYSALAPHISAQIMELHHSKHHAAYVAGANTALEKLAEGRDANDFANINRLQKDLAFHLGGHTNHSIFWKNLTPDSQERPSGELASGIDEYFGSFDKFRAHFNAAALGLQGSGWAFLAWDAIGGQLIIEQLYDQQGNIAAATTPLLMLDMWEHAYYIDFRNARPNYITTYLDSLVNWDFVAQNMG